MGRDLSCPSGKKAFRKKADALDAVPVVRDRVRPPDHKLVGRCHRCRWWHLLADRGKSVRSR